MKRIKLSTFLLLMFVTQLCVGLVMLSRRPAYGVVRQEITRLKLVQANLQRAGILTSKKNKMITEQLESLKKWDY